MRRTKYSVGLGIALGVLVLLFFKTFISFCLGAVVGVLVGVTLAALVITKGSSSEASVAKEKGNDKPMSTTTDDQESRSKELKGFLDGLADFNLAIRVNGLEQELLVKVEEVIDLLLDLLPVVYGEFSGLQTTWELKRTASEYLPGLVTAYLGLPEENRSSSKEEFLSRLGHMHDLLTKAKELATTRNRVEFETLVTFLKMKE